MNPNCACINFQDRNSARTIFTLIHTPKHLSLAYNFSLTLKHYCRLFFLHLSCLSTLLRVVLSLIQALSIDTHPQISIDPSSTIIHHHFFLCFILREACSCLYSPAWTSIRFSRIPSRPVSHCCLPCIVVWLLISYRRCYSREC